jgi:hypothetical protein
LAVVGKTAGDIATRSQTFAELAYQQLQQPDFVAANVSFHPPSANILAEAYFALSEAYKRRRLKDDSRSDWSKAAALTAITVSVINPIRPAGPANQPQWPYLNPQFGLLCAHSFSQKVFQLPGFDQQRRLFQSWQSAKLPCLSPIIAEGNANGGNFTSNWEISISDNEMAYLDLMITMFVILIGQPERK